MKRIVSIAFACAMAMPALAGALYAQDSGSRNLPPAYDQASNLRHKGRQAKFAAKLKADLGLTDDQVKKLSDAMKAKWDTLKTSGEALRADMKTLRGQIEKKAADQDIQATLNKLKTDREAMAAAMRGAEAKFEADTSFLTPTQRAKMLLGRMRRMHKHGRDGHGRRGHDGPPPAGQQ
ncbi:MAG TPA: hypothetical protein VNK24_10245 [Elusimicrobiota bacterium]|nr:hypothetical protein [Elusimicrobiota bacterium]